MKTSDQPELRKISRRQLKKILKKHKKWYKRVYLEHKLPDLKGEKADLRDVDLRGINLQKVDLREAYLEGANFHKVDLKEAYLNGADLEHAKLKGADLQKTDLTFARLQFADLREADLQGATLYLADLEGANLRGANLQHAKIEIEKLSEVKTLYRAKLDDELEEEIEKDYPHLLEEPESEVKEKIDTGEMMESFKQNVEKLKKRGDIEGLIKVASHMKENRTRHEALQALREMGNSASAAVDPLLEILKDKKEISDIRCAAGRALWFLGDVGEKAIIQALREEDSVFRSYALDYIDMVKYGNIRGLFHLFNKGDWNTREDVTVAFMNIRNDTDYDKEAMIKALKDIVLLCKASTTGGSYRESCLNIAEKLLSKELNANSSKNKD